MRSPRSMQSAEGIPGSQYRNSWSQDSTVPALSAICLKSSWSRVPCALYEASIWDSHLRSDSHFARCKAEKTCAEQLQSSKAGLSLMVLQSKVLKRA